MPEPEEDFRIAMIHEAYENEISNKREIKTAIENLLFDETPIPQAVRDIRTALLVAMQDEIDGLPPLEELQGKQPAYEPNVSKDKKK